MSKNINAKKLSKLKDNKVVCEQVIKECKWKLPMCKMTNHIQEGITSGKNPLKETSILIQQNTAKEHTKTNRAKDKSSSFEPLTNRLCEPARNLKSKGDGKIKNKYPLNLNGKEVVSGEVRKDISLFSMETNASGSSADNNHKSKGVER